MAPLFSVIIPTFERPDLLKLAVDSVLRQTFSDFECLIIDDGSQSPVPPFNDDRITVIPRHQTGGPAAARNTGIEAATGSYLTFLDDDDLYTPDRLNIALKGLNRAPVSICRSAFIGSQAKPQRHLEGNIHDVILERTTPHLGTVTVARDSFLPFNPVYKACEDLEWWLRTSRDLAVTILPEVGYLVRRHGEQRGIHGTGARIDFSLRLLDEYAFYFDNHPRAAAFRWRRIGLMMSELGDAQGARSAFVKSLRRSPSLKSVWHLARGVVAPTKSAASR